MSVNTVLIVGASGLVGTAAANAFINAGWQVIACSRRYPDLINSANFLHVPLDLRDSQACAEVAAKFSSVTHVVYTAVYELPGLVQGWSDPEQIATNDTMLRNLMEPLCHKANIRHVTLLQGTKAYGITRGPMRVPGRESQPRVEHPNFYWVQEDYLKQKSSTEGFAVTIFRPQLIVGPNHGVVMNLPPVVGIYAAIRHAEGLPFSFPGGPHGVWEAVDVRLVGNACLWAATHDVANHETFNLTNGEVFSWRDMWPAIAATLGVSVGTSANPVNGEQTVADDPQCLASYIPARESVWNGIVEQHGLQKIPLQNLLGESHYYADLCFAYGATRAPDPTFVSTVKIKQAGFTETCDSEQSFCYWLEDLIERKIIPRF